MNVRALLFAVALTLTGASGVHAQTETSSPASTNDPTTSSTSRHENAAQHTGFEFLGPAREISHSTSASRDTALVAIVFTPRLVRTAGADFAIASYAAEDFTLRLGVFGMLELFGEGRVAQALPFPVGDIGLWRGLFGYSVAASFDTLARNLCGDHCGLEATLSFRHESEHHTASNDGITEAKYVGYPHIGDFVMPDIALRLPMGDWELTARAQAKIWVSRDAQAPYRFGPGGDVVVRWKVSDRIHPFTATFAEYYFAKDNLDAYFIRNLTGVLLPSRYGEISLHFVSEVGNGKGFMVLQEEASFGVGARFGFL